MGNAISGEVDRSLEVTGNFMNKLGLPRPAAITEGKRIKTSVRPPGASKTAAEDLPFIQAYIYSHLSKCPSPHYASLVLKILHLTSMVKNPGKLVP